MLLSVSADIRVEEDARAGVWMAVHEVLFVTFAIGAIMVYGPLRTRALELLRFEGPDSVQVLHAFATFSWLYMVYAVVHTVPVKALLLRGTNTRV